MRFWKRGKLSPRYVGQFEMLEQVGEVAYKLSLPLSLSAVHYVLHVSLLKRYVPDLSYQISYEELELPLDLLYEEEVMRILDCYSMILH